MSAPELAATGPHTGELGVLVGGSSYFNPREQRTVFAIDVLDLDRDAYQSIRVDFLAHGFCTDPRRPHIAALFEKRGPDACIVDLAASRMLHPIVAGAGRAFYGHGVFSPDGAHLLSVEIRTDTHAGLLTVRDAATLAPVDELPTYGENPHDCVLLEDGRTLVITNGGGELGSRFAPSVTFVDLASRALLEKVVLSDPKINAGHVAVAKNGDFALVSAPRDGLPERTSLGGVTLRTHKRKPERMRSPAAVTSRMVGESLSVAIHEPSRVAAATSPFGDLVTFWDLDRKKLLRSLDLEAARGVAVSLDQRRFIVTYGGKGSRVLIDTSTLEPVPGSERTTGRFSGSHVHVWRRSGQAGAAEPRAPAEALDA